MEWCLKLRSSTEAPAAVHAANVYLLVVNSCLQGPEWMAQSLGKGGLRCVALLHVVGRAVRCCDLSY